ncbi:hypothetical protein [Pontiella sulfatireligans]|uniref:hypothetical protein n=1 Tax=Pontiella sulfatireligans TaxID=2750658 RepID=UPI00109CB2C3|nr:hypothetical protein [Pontiella sulfatireligans]
MNEGQSIIPRYFLMGTAGIFVLRNQSASQFVNTIEGTPAIIIGSILFVVSSYFILRDYLSLSKVGKSGLTGLMIVFYIALLSMIWISPSFEELKKVLIYSSLIGIFIVGNIFERITYRELK